MTRFNRYSMMVEVAWAVISVIGLIRLYIIHKYFRFTDEEQAAAKRYGKNGNIQPLCHFAASPQPSRPAGVT